MMKSIDHVTEAEALSLSPGTALSQWPQGHQWKADPSASPFYPQPSHIPSGKGDKSSHRRQSSQRDFITMVHSKG